MAWRPTSGVAIITNSRLANGPHQVTIISGDHLQIIETTGDWLRGRNLVTGVAGIFPARFCVIVRTTPDSPAALLSNPMDLLYYETSLTLGEALKSLQNTRNSIEYLKLTDRLFDVMTQLVLCEGNPSAEQISAAHTTLGSSLDNLRSALLLGKKDRTASSTPRTLSTWCRQFVLRSKESELISKPLEYVILHCSVEVQTMKKQMICRFFLWDGLLKKFLSVPVSVTSSEGSLFCLVFDQLEMRQVQSEKIEGKPDHLWLVIYIYNLVAHREGQFDERKFVSCAVQKLPKSRIHPKSNKYFGKCRTYEMQSWTSTNKSLLPSLHTVLADPLNPAVSDKAMVRFGPTFIIKFTPFFGPTDDIVRGQNLRLPQIIPPMQLPLQISPRLRRSLVTVNVSSLNLDNRPRRYRLIFRVIDSGTKTFVRCIENIMFLSYEDSIWCTAVSSGKRSADLTETFSLDLSNVAIPLISMFICVQVDKGTSDKHLSPFAYGLIQLASEIGAITPKLEGVVSLFDFKPSGKVIQPTDFSSTSYLSKAQKAPDISHRFNKCIQ
jgi:hypothetical protein